MVARPVYRVSFAFISTLAPTLSRLRTYSSQAKKHFLLTRAKTKRRLFNAHNSDQTDTSDVSVNDSVVYAERKAVPSPDTGKRESEPDVLYGYHPIVAALQNHKRHFHEVYVRNSLYKLMNEERYPAPVVQCIHQEALRRQLPLIPVHKNKLDQLSLYATHQGMCARVSPFISPYFSTTELPTRKDSQTAGQPLLWIMIDQVKDPMNVGGLIRNAAFFGVSKVLVTAQCSRLSPVVSKASAGAMESASIRRVARPENLCYQLRDRSWNIVGTVCSPSVSTRLHKLLPSISGNTLLIVGSEGYGVEDKLKDCCTHLVTIDPHQACPSVLDSLNVSVATGILLHSLSSRLLQDHGDPVR